NTLSDKSGNWRRRPFMDLYLRLIAAVEIQAAVAIMAAQSTVHTYISVTAEKMEKPPVTMFPIKRRHRSAKALRLGPNSKGYGAFSVGISQVQETVHYIEQQLEHHRTRTFQEEYLALLKKHGANFD